MFKHHVTIFRPSSDNKIEPEEDYHFVDKPSEDYFCPIMSVVLLEPHLTECCGKHLSERAVEQLRRHGLPCPLCNKALVTIRDIHFRRQVLELPVFCPNKSRGCKWVAELSALQSHVENCPFQCNTAISVKPVCAKPGKIDAYYSARLSYARDVTVYEFMAVHQVLLHLGMALQL